MAGPGTPGWAVPAGEDYLVRENAERKRENREGMASIAASVGPIVARLDAKDTALDAAVAAIAAQQVTINAQVASIAALVGQQTTAAAATPASASGWASSTGQTTKASTSIAVPAGFTQAMVWVSGSITFQDSAPNRFDTRVGIAAGYSPALPSLANTAASSAASHSRYLAGLSGGSISLEVQMLSAVATGGVAANTAIVSGFAIFFR